MNVQSNRKFPWWLMAGDLFVLGLFVILGRQEHELMDAGNPLWGLLLTAGVFALPWLAAGLLLGAFPRGAISPRALLGRSLSAWLIAAPLGILLRALVLGRATIPTSFFIVILVLGGVFMLGWRLAAALYWRTRHSRERKQAA